MSTTQATTIAAALLAEYENGGDKNQFVLAEVRTPQGVPVPLWQVRAGMNIYLPEAGPAQLVLPLTATAGQNLFYITETEYKEQSGQTPQLTITTETFADQAAFMIGRLQYQADLEAKNDKTLGKVQGSGSPETGSVSVSWPSSALATDVYEVNVNFKTTMSNVPTSIALTASATAGDVVNAGTPGTAHITVYGFSLTISPAANGVGKWRGTYTTAGN